MGLGFQVYKSNLIDFLSFLCAAENIFLPSWCSHWALRPGPGLGPAAAPEEKSETTNCISEILLHELSNFFVRVQNYMTALYFFVC